MSHSIFFLISRITQKIWEWQKPLLRELLRKKARTKFLRDFWNSVKKTRSRERWLSRFSSNTQETTGLKSGDERHLWWTANNMTTFISRDEREWKQNIKTKKMCEKQTQINSELHKYIFVENKPDDVKNWALKI